MGIYATIQTKLSEAFDTKLTDAVSNIIVTEFGESVYDTSAGTNVTPETTYTVRAVEVSNNEGEILNLHALRDRATFLVLDSEKQLGAFKIGMKIDKGEHSFRITGISADPAQATWQLVCKRWA